MHKYCFNNIEEMHILAYDNLEEMHNDINNQLVKPMYFKRKAYNKLLYWKEHYADNYAVLLEGARRVGKSTIAIQFAEKEYKSYILLDFSKTSKDIIACFDDIQNLDLFFLRLQTITGTNLFIHESVIIFDEVQLFPKARQAIKHLIKDSRYHYIETGSLISIKKNVKDILIPSEEMKIEVYPMDYEEFCDATKINYQILQPIFEKNVSIGQSINRKLMRDIRVYMAVGGMPQAVDAYVKGENFSKIDEIKRQIIKLYEEDFKKIDQSGRLSSMYHSIPAQLSKHMRKYKISMATGKRKSSKDNSLMYDLIDSKTVLPCYNSTDPRVSFSLSKDLDSYKLYLSDTGLFVTLMFIDRPITENEIYAKLLSDKLSANLGYLYENLVAQMIVARDRELFYHTWEKNGSTHYYEIDFLLSHKDKITAIEVKSSGVGKHESLSEFQNLFSKHVNDCIILSQKDISKNNNIRNIPIYFTPFLCE